MLTVNQQNNLKIVLMEGAQAALKGERRINKLGFKSTVESKYKEQIRMGGGSRYMQMEHMKGST